MTSRFVSVLGVDQYPGADQDVRFKQIVPDFKTARAESVALKTDGYSPVIYRLSHNGEYFYSSRQFDIERGDGNESYADEPKGLPALCYELYSVANDLLDSPKLGELVGQIRKLSHQPRPGVGKP